MLKSMLFAVLFFSTTLLCAQINFLDAVANGDITVKVKSLGGISNKCLSLTFEKTSKKNLKIIIPAGYLFEAADSTTQDILTLENTIFTLSQPKQFIKIGGFCAEAHNSSPSANENFDTGKKVSGNLLKLAEYLNSKQLYRESSAQMAVWAVTDSFDVASITHPGILAFTCQLLNVPLPSYKAKYEVRNAPSTPAHRAPIVEPTPFAYEGNFEHQSNVACKVSVYMVNEQGETVRTMFADREHLPGWAKYSFYFKTTRLPKGSYEIVFAVDGKVTKKIKVRY
jgi:hypothetical protein